MEKIIIIGAGGFGREVVWLIERINMSVKKWDILGYIDEDKEIKGKDLDGYPVLGGLDIIKSHEDAYYVCAIGSAKNRESMVNRIASISCRIRYATLIDPSVILSDKVRIGRGTIICAGTILTVDIDIKSHVIINLDCTIGHDVVIDDFVTLYPSINVSGHVTLSKCAEIGTGTQIIQGKQIGAGTIVGAGSVVIKDLPDECTALGVPAKPIKFHE